MKLQTYEVVVRPLVTEKSTHQAGVNNCYAFEVHPEANKAQIKQAVEKIYDVKVQDVRTSLRRGKPRRTRFVQSVTKHWKKAVVVLHPEYRIDLF